MAFARRTRKRIRQGYTTQNIPRATFIFLLSGKIYTCVKRLLRMDKQVTVDSVPFVDHFVIMQMCALCLPL